MMTQTQTTRHKTAVITAMFLQLSNRDFYKQGCTPTSPSTKKTVLSIFLLLFFSSNPFDRPCNASLPRVPFKLTTDTARTKEETQFKLTCEYPGTGSRHTGTCALRPESQDPPGQDCHSVHTRLGTWHPPTPSSRVPHHAPAHSELWTCWSSPEESASTAMYV